MSENYICYYNNRRLSEPFCQTTGVNMRMK